MQSSFEMVGKLVKSEIGSESQAFCAHIGNLACYCVQRMNFVGNVFDDTISTPIRLKWLSK